MKYWARDGCRKNSEKIKIIFQNFPHLKTHAHIHLHTRRTYIDNLNCIFFQIFAQSVLADKIKFQIDKIFGL